ncbi:MAG: antibiotic biosynthesis monooxygenase [Verrucomicrobia bacterium]|nr:antibiotic biosynthesis monooxygenase [Verrucomicrobiota bacterium]
MPSPIPVSIHPYFQVRAGQMPAAKALLQEFIARTKTEPGVLYYQFTLGGDVIFCREAYRDADALLAHVGNVGAQVEAMLKISTLVRVEVHGPAAEIAKLQAPLAGLNPAWFVYECGLER